MKIAMLTLALLLFGGIAMGQTNVQFSGYGIMSACHGYTVTEVDFQPVTGGSVTLCTIYAYNLFRIDRYDDAGNLVYSFRDLVVTHKPTTAEPWMAFTYNNGNDSAVVQGKWVPNYKSGLNFYYTNGTLTEQ